MTLALSFPDCAQSPLGTLDPRWKLAAFLGAAFTGALLQTLPAAAATLAGALVLARLARLPACWLLVRLGSVALVLAFFLAWLPFAHPGPRHDLGWFAIAPDGLRLALLLVVKALTIVTLMVTLFATAPLQDICKAAHALRLPGMLVHLVLLTYRFVFLVREEFVRLRTALRVRGFRNRASLQSYRTIAQVAGTLLVRSHDRADRVAQAMRCRGFDGRFRSLHEFGTRIHDVLAFAAIFGSAVALLAWDLLER
jgi:cobalt/nickel transport system permease protein